MRTLAHFLSWICTPPDYGRLTSLNTWICSTWRPWPTRCPGAPTTPMRRDVNTCPKGLQLDVRPSKQHTFKDLEVIEEENSQSISDPKTTNNDCRNGSSCGKPFALTGSVQFACIRVTKEERDVVHQKLGVAEGPSILEGTGGGAKVRRKRCMTKNTPHQRCCKHF